LKDTLLLALETSCDETSAAIIKNGTQVLSNIISTQIPTHQKYGGVVPEIASRKHLENVTPVIDEAISVAGIKIQDVDAISVTYGPGLVGALLVGVATAKAMAYSLNIPLIGVHHLRGHIYANLLSHPNLEFPVICLVVSGGHTSLIYWKSHEELELLGSTRDDAAGEAFDKIARALKLGYPGGPKIQAAAELGNKNAIDFPRSYLEEGSLDFSFSGLKSSVLNYLHKAAQKNESISVEDVSASFQEAVVDVLVDKGINACLTKDCRKITLAGGVAANSRLREKLEQKAKEHNIEVYYPELIFCTDNAAMIGCAGYYEFIQGKTSPLDLNAIPNLPLV
jgi:N6-L-threonylcarbamoyladenine synthase